MSNNEEIEQVGPSEEAEPTPKEVVEEEEKKEKVRINGVLTADWEG